MSAAQIWIDKLDAIEVVRRFWNHLDARDWRLLEKTLDATVKVDITALWGGEPSSSPRSALVDGFQTNLAGFRCVHHMLGNEVADVRDDEATVDAHVREHFEIAAVSGSSSWGVGGRYVCKLVRRNGEWRIGEIAFRLAWAEGNPELFRLAARGDAGSGQTKND